MSNQCCSLHDYNYTVQLYSKEKSIVMAWLQWGLRRSIYRYRSDSSTKRLFWLEFFYKEVLVLFFLCFVFHHYVYWLVWKKKMSSILIKLSFSPKKLSSPHLSLSVPIVIKIKLNNNIPLDALAPDNAFPGYI